MSKLLKPAVNGTAFAKLGIQGFQKSGKTYTASEIAIGLTKASKGKSIAFFDTEKGSDFVKPKIEKAGLTLLTHRGRAFVDLLSVMREAEAEKIPVLIIDSITHVWNELCNAILQKRNKQVLTMPMRQVLNRQWEEYTNLYLNSKLHIVMCGRAGYEYDNEDSEDEGMKLVKVGTKMKVQGETGFEPDLLLEMEREHLGDKIVNNCWVIGDRSNTMNGKKLVMPNYESFSSFWKFINLGGEHVGIDVTRNSQGAIENPDWSVANLQKRREIAVEELQAHLIKTGMDGTSAEAKKNRTLFLEQHFGTSSKTAIESMHPTDLEAKLKEIKGVVAPQAEEDVPEWSQGGTNLPRPQAKQEAITQ